MPKAHFSVSIMTRAGFALAKNIERVARSAEALGYDSVAFGDHIHLDRSRHEYYSYGVERGPDYSKDPNMFESISTVSYLAGLCPDLKFHTGVLFLPSRNPVVLAKETSTIDALTGGRFSLGVGVGNVTDTDEYKALGLPFEKRWQIGEEYMAAMKEIWTTPLSSYHGDFVNFEGLVVYPKPVSKPHVPLWFGGKSAAAMRMVAKYCTGWLPQFMPPERHAEGLEQIKKMAREYGRGDVRFTMGAQIYVSLAKTEAEAEARWNARLADAAAMNKYVGFMREIGSNVREELTQRCVMGPSSKVNERLDRYKKSGVELFEIHFTYTNMEQMMVQMRQFAKDVIPSI